MTQTNTPGPLTHFSFNVDGGSYLGAGHGIVGVLYMLLKGIQVITKFKEDKHFMKLLENTVDRTIN